MPHNQFSVSIQGENEGEPSPEERDVLLVAGGWWAVVGLVLMSHKAGVSTKEQPFFPCPFADMSLLTLQLDFVIYNVHVKETSKLRKRKKKNLNHGE